MDEIQKQLFAQIADLHEVPQGAYNFRVNGEGAGRNTTENIDIITKADKPGIDIIIKAGTKNESVHIPVVISQIRRPSTTAFTRSMWARTPM